MMKAYPDEEILGSVTQLRRREAILLLEQLEDTIEDMPDGVLLPHEHERLENIRHQVEDLHDDMA